MPRHSKLGELAGQSSSSSCSPPGSAGTRQQRAAGSQEQLLAPPYFRKCSWPDGQSEEEEQARLAARTELQNS